MSTLSDVENYLAARAEVERRHVSEAVRPAALPFVTISRQAGAGGHSLAQALLQAMAEEQDRALFEGWQVLDDKLCTELMGHQGLQDSMRQLLHEEYHSKISEFVLGLLGRQTPQDSVVRRQSEVIRSLATLGKVIVVGRAGRQASKGLHYGVHLRLIAPEAVRVKRMMALLGQSEGEVERIVKEQDHARARLLKDHYRTAIDDPLLYDMIWNTENAPLSIVSQSIIALIKHRQSRPQTR